MVFPSVWDLIDRYKARCAGKGWEICGNEDLIKVRNEYHYFIWSHNINIDTFKRVVNLVRRIPIRDGISSKFVNVSYLVWISPALIPEEALEIFLEAPSLSREVAVYDMSPIYENQLICFRMNETDSLVFRDFERFLTEEFQIEFKPLCNRYSMITH